MSFAETDRINCLFDIYQNLLTKHQKDIIISYYQEDLSLSEIAENLEISRNAVFSLIKRVAAILEDYESKLHLYEKKMNLYKLMDQNTVDSSLRTKIEKIIEE